MEAPSSSTVFLSLVNYGPDQYTQVFQKLGGENSHITLNVHYGDIVNVLMGFYMYIYQAKTKYPNLYD